MAKQSNNALIIFLCITLGLGLPLTAWLLLRTMTHERVIDIQTDRLKRNEKELSGLRDEIKEELERLRAARKALKVPD